MAYVITVVGAGGKTSYIRRRAAEAVKKGQKVAVTTTTHIWNPPADDPLRQAGVIFIGTPVPGREKNMPGKLGELPEGEYKRLCADFDLILVEGDGAHCMPMKIPGENEPVIPANTDEIVVVMGSHAIGRAAGTVCHRFEQYGERIADLCDSNTTVTEEILYQTAERCYLQPLRSAEEDTRDLQTGAVQGGTADQRSSGKPTVSYYLSDMEKSYRQMRDSSANKPEGSEGQQVQKLALVVTASGFGQRFGGNKLLHPYKGTPLYRHILENLMKAGAQIEEKYGIDILLIVVSQYPELLRDAEHISRNYDKEISGLYNKEAAEGIAASIRIGTQAALKAGADGAVFFAADMPELPEEDIERFLHDFIFSGKTYACMEIMPGHIPVNPGAFRFGKQNAAKDEESMQEENPQNALLQLHGDKGAMRIIRCHPDRTCCYQIEEWKVRDIDRKSDLTEGEVSRKGEACR